MEFLVKRRGAETAAWIAGLVLLALLMFHPLWTQPDRALFSTDNNIGHNAQLRAKLPWAFAAGWDDSVLVGLPGTMGLGLTSLLAWPLPLTVYHNWIHAFHLAGASLALVLFLRRRGLGAAAAALGALTAFWLGSNLTLTYAGHTNKFGILFFAAWFLFFADRAAAADRGAARGAAALAAGGALGMMFVEQADVALFFALALGPYLLFALWRAWPSRPAAALPPLLAAGLVAGLLAWRPIWEGYRTSIAGISVVQQDDARAKWDFVTQWSWPPEETLDFIAPGYYGWRSGEPTGPYWGRMGRSAEWERTGQGFMNFKLENQYLGAIPLLFAAAALGGLRRRGGGAADAAGGRRPEILFWTVVATATFLLACGKYLPLYSLFYRLPLVGAIRNPNKFLQVFQLAIGVLAAYGAERMVTEDGKRKTEDGRPEKPENRTEFHPQPRTSSNQERSPTKNFFQPRTLPNQELLPTVP